MALILDPETNTYHPEPGEGMEFEALRLDGLKWEVLSPWIQALEGSWYRHLIQVYPGADSEMAEQYARHLAAQLNAARTTPRVGE